MLNKRAQRGALITREAHVALRQLKSLVEKAVKKAHTASLETAGLTVDKEPVIDPLIELRVAADTLQSPAFDEVLTDVRAKVGAAIAWHEEKPAHKAKSHGA
jgi:hypothetical protein